MEESVPKIPNISPSKFLKNRNQMKFVIAHVSNEEILDIKFSRKQIHWIIQYSLEIVIPNTRLNYITFSLYH